jgi:phytoene dehydrogenase-like protein
MKSETLLKVLMKQLEDHKEDIIKEYGEEGYNRMCEGIPKEIPTLMEHFRTRDISNFDPVRDRPPGMEKNKKAMKFLNDIERAIANE